ncbi:MAG: hypothetical protein ACI85O_000721 [Saprospiraceae bacterium]|jgi:hypothetical protein
MKKNLLLFCLSLICSFVLAQGSQDFFPCGSPTAKSPWLKKYQANPSDYNTKDNEVLYVPLTIHILGSDIGTGYFPKRSVLNALCTLNEDYMDTELHFYVEGDFNYIDNSAWNSHDSVPQGYEMMATNNIENTINCYFLSDPAGNCGYNLPYAGMAMAKSCAGADDHTWAHEMGHQLALPHPFLGWEGGISYDGSIPTSYGSPAPDTVLYDYTYFQQDMLYLYADTIIIDTTEVERMDGSNCTHAADGFCDTSPDYLNYRWQCNGDALSTVTQHDPEDIPFQSDGTLIMSYAFDACSYRFSPEQIAAMRANLIDTRPELLENQTPGLEPGDIVLISPINGEDASYQNTVLDWEDTENATAYLVKLEIIIGSSSITITNIETTESQITLENNLTIGSTYRYTIRTYNNYYFCDEYTAEGEFVAAEVSSVQNIAGLKSFSVRPNILTASSSQIFVHATFDSPRDLQWNLTDITGKDLNSGQFASYSSTINESIELNNLSAGVYFFGIGDETGVAYEKIVVQ